MSRLQVGRYGEMAAMMAFLVHGFDVYSTEVDERGIDFVTRRTDAPFYEVQVKTLRALDYTFMRKSTFPGGRPLQSCGHAPACRSRRPQGHRQWSSGPGGPDRSDQTCVRRGQPDREQTHPRNRRSPCFRWECFAGT
jgi:hypothetical protein